MQGIESTCSGSEFNHYPLRIDIQIVSLLGETGVKPEQALFVAVPKRVVGYDIKGPACCLAKLVVQEADGTKQRRITLVDINRSVTVDGKDAVCGLNERRLGYNLRLPRFLRPGAGSDKKDTAQGYEPTNFHNC